MRFALLFAGSLVVATPAAAQERLRPAPEAEVAARLNDPLVQEGIARAMAAMTGALLDMRVGPLASLTTPEADIGPNDTLRDLKRRDDPDFERRLYSDTRRGTALAGRVAGDMAAMVPEFERTIARLQGTLGASLGALGDDGRYRDDYDDDY